MKNELSYDEMELLLQPWIDKGIEEFNLAGVIVVCVTKGDHPNYIFSKGTHAPTEELLAIQRKEIATMLIKFMDDLQMEYNEGMSNTELFGKIGKILGGKK